MKLKGRNKDLANLEKGADIGIVGKRDRYVLLTFKVQVGVLIKIKFVIQTKVISNNNFASFLIFNCLSFLIMLM